jgi:arsenate reductase
MLQDMAIAVYERRTCMTCRQLAALLEARGVDFERVEYHVEGLREDELRGLLAKAGLRPRQALQMREAGAAELADADDETVIAAMLARPELLQRPFVVNGERAVLARPIERALEVLQPV